MEIDIPQGAYDHKLTSHKKSNFFLPAATARWSINAVFPSPSGQRTIEHGVIETNELYMTYESY